MMPTVSSIWACIAAVFGLAWLGPAEFEDDLEARDYYFLDELD